MKKERREWNCDAEPDWARVELFKDWSDPIYMNEQQLWSGLILTPPLSLWSRFFASSPSGSQVFDPLLPFLVSLLRPSRFGRASSPLSALSYFRPLYDLWPDWTVNSWAITSLPGVNRIGLFSSVLPVLSFPVWSVSLLAKLSYLLPS